jgi:hypothetical protein
MFSSISVQLVLLHRPLPRLQIKAGVGCQKNKPMVCVFALNTAIAAHVALFTRHQLLLSGRNNQRSSKNKRCQQQQNFQDHKVSKLFLVEKRGD